MKSFPLDLILGLPRFFELAKEIHRKRKEKTQKKTKKKQKRKSRLTKRWTTRCRGQSRRSRAPPATAATSASPVRRRRISRRRRCWNGATSRSTTVSVRPRSSMKFKKKNHQNNKHQRRLYLPKETKKEPTVKQKEPIGSSIQHRRRYSDRT